MNEKTAVGKISKQALLSFNMAKTDEEANKIIAENLAQEMLKMIQSESSVNAVLNSVKKYVEENSNIQIPDDVFDTYVQAVLDGKENDEVIDSMMKYTENIDAKDLTIYALNEVHNEWVKNNKYKFADKKRWFQFLPLEYLGWKEVDKDFIYVKPIIESLRKEVSPETIKTKYLTKVNEYLKAHNIKNRKYLEEELKETVNTYEPLDEYQKEEMLKDENYGMLVDEVYDRGIGQDKEELKKLLEDELILKNEELNKMEEKTINEGELNKELNKDLNKNFNKKNIGE